MERLIGGSVDGLELYPASEGFIAYQDSQKEKGMFLCVNHGIFYEFIPIENSNEQEDKIIPLEYVQINQIYSI